MKSDLEDLTRPIVPIKINKLHYTHSTAGKKTFVQNDNKEVSKRWCTLYGIMTSSRSNQPYRIFELLFSRGSSCWTKTSFEITYAFQKMGLLQSLILRHFKLWCCFDTTLCVIAKYGVFNCSVLSSKITSSQLTRSASESHCWQKKEHFTGTKVCANA